MKVVVQTNILSGISYGILLGISPVIMCPTRLKMQPTIHLESLRGYCFVFFSTKKQYPHT